MKSDVKGFGLGADDGVEACEEDAGVLVGNLDNFGDGGTGAAGEVFGNPISGAAAAVSDGEAVGDGDHNGGVAVELAGFEFGGDFGLQALDLLGFGGGALIGGALAFGCLAGDEAARGADAAGA